MDVQLVACGAVEGELIVCDALQPRFAKAAGTGHASTML